MVPRIGATRCIAVFEFAGPTLACYPKAMARWNVASCVVVIICAQHALGHAEEAKPVAASTKPTAAEPTAATPTATAPKKPKKPRKRAAAEQDRLIFEQSKDGRAFADLISTKPVQANVSAEKGLPTVGGPGGGWVGVGATKCCGEDPGGGGGGGGVGTAVGVGTGTGYSGYGPRDKAPSTGSVHLVVRGVGEPLPATAAIRSRIATRMASVKRCAQVSGATVASKTTVEFAIDEAGRVVVVKATGDNQVVVDCVAKLAPAWRLPAPETNTAQTRFEVTFTSTP